MNESRSKHQRHQQLQSDFPFQRSIPIFPPSYETNLFDVLYVNQQSERVSLDPFFAKIRPPKMDSSLISEENVGSWFYRLGDQNGVAAEAGFGAQAVGAGAEYFRGKKVIDKIEFRDIQRRSLVEFTKEVHIETMFYEYAAHDYAIKSLWERLPDGYNDEVVFAVVMTAFKAKRATYYQSKERKAAGGANVTAIVGSFMAGLGGAKESGIFLETGGVVAVDVFCFKVKFITGIDDESDVRMLTHQQISRGVAVLRSSEGIAAMIETLKDKNKHIKYVPFAKFISEFGEGGGILLNTEGLDSDPDFQKMLKEVNEFLSGNETTDGQSDAAAGQKRSPARLCLTIFVFVLLCCCLIACAWLGLAQQRESIKWRDRAESWHEVAEAWKEEAEQLKKSHLHCFKIFKFERCLRVFKPAKAKDIPVGPILTNITSGPSSMSWNGTLAFSLLILTLTFGDIAGSVLDIWSSVRRRWMARRTGMTGNDDAMVVSIKEQLRTDKVIVFVQSPATMCDNRINLFLFNREISGDGRSKVINCNVNDALETILRMLRESNAGYTKGGSQA